MSDNGNGRKQRTFFSCCLKKNIFIYFVLVVKTLSLASKLFTTSPCVPTAYLSWLKFLKLNVLTSRI